jgi:hypothetical protein
MVCIGLRWHSNVIALPMNFMNTLDGGVGVSLVSLQIYTRGIASGTDCIGGFRDRMPQGRDAAGTGGRRDTMPQGQDAAGTGCRRDPTAGLKSLKKGDVSGPSRNSKHDS